MNSLVIYGIVGLGLLTAGFLGGWQVESWRNDAAQLKVQQLQQAAILDAVEKARALGIAEGNITFTAGQKAAQEQIKIVTRTVTQIKEVPTFVTPKASAACVVPLGFIQLHNAGATGADSPSAAFPLAAAQSVDTASTVSLATVASTVRENYGRCESNANELSALQGWVLEQKALHK